MKGGLEDPNHHYPLPPIPPLQHLDVPRSPARRRRREVLRFACFWIGSMGGAGFPADSVPHKLPCVRQREVARFTHPLDVFSSPCTPSTY